MTRMLLKCFVSVLSLAGQAASGRDGKKSTVQALTVEAGGHVVQGPITGSIGTASSRAGTGSLKNTMISTMSGTEALDNELSKGSVTAATVTLGRLFATAKEEEEEELLTELRGGESEEELLTELQESSELLLVSANSKSVAVSKAQKLEASTATDGGEGSTLVHLSNFQTTLKYVRARSALTKVSEERIPQIVPVIQEEQEKIKGDQGNAAKFYFCLHVGTTADAENPVIKQGLLDRRYKNFKKALEKSGAFKDALVFGEGIPHHKQPDNFATFMMKTYTGDVEPSCNAEDLEAQ